LPKNGLIKFISKSQKGSQAVSPRRGRVDLEKLYRYYEEKCGEF
jgi:hypothetical protein